VLTTAIPYNQGGWRTYEMEMFLIIDKLQTKSYGGQVIQMNSFIELKTANMA
jgi:hypothetical protein